MTRRKARRSFVSTLTWRAYRLGQDLPDGVLRIRRSSSRRAVIDTVQVNGYKACYIRPLMYRGYGALGVNPLPCPVDVAIMVWEWGAYLGADALEKGVDVCVSSWNRMAPNTFPSLSKTSGNYANAALIRMEAEANGYSEGIALDTFGYVSEGSGENIFIVRNGVIHTPPLSASILPGITRDMVIQIAEDLGYRVSQENIPREMLYIADEVFFVGTAVELTPVRSVDKIQVGNGRRGPDHRSHSAPFPRYPSRQGARYPRVAHLRAGDGRRGANKPLNRHEVRRIRSRGEDDPARRKTRTPRKPRISAHSAG